MSGRSGGLRTGRLELRPVSRADLDDAVRLGTDERVMAFLAGAMSPEGCAAWHARQLSHWERHGFGRYHVTCNGVFVGYVGLMRDDFDAGVVPGVEVAWRLAFEAWGMGYATEAARVVMSEGFERGLDAIVAVTATGNAQSRRVMDRLGMAWSPRETFEYPRLPAGHPLREHVVYRVKREEWGERTGGANP
jgi:RimJ/RimL family protein N-acetyltransferase